MIGGRGFIAIVAVIFGGWTLRGTIIGCVLFGFVEALTITTSAKDYTARPVRADAAAVRRGVWPWSCCSRPGCASPGPWPNRS